MSLTFLNTNDYNVKLKCSIQATGKLGFTDATAIALKLAEEKKYVRFANDSDNPEQLYMVFVPTNTDGAFIVRKSGTYFYLPTESLFESLNYNFRDVNYMFDLVRMANLDKEANGEVYKMNVRKKNRKGGEIEG